MSLATRVKDEPEDIPNRVTVKEEAEIVDEDCEECVKEEPGCEDVGGCGAREAALASLYADHVVKDELVLGPELPHRPEGGLVVCEWALDDADGCLQAPDARGGAQLALRNCSVRLERLPHREAMLHNNLQETAGQEDYATTHADRHSDIEEEFLEPATPELTSSAENKTHITDNEDKKKCVSGIPGARGETQLAMRDCSVRLERFPHRDAIARDNKLLGTGQDNNPTTYTDGHTDIEEELQGPATPELNSDAENKKYTTDIGDKKECVCDICRKTFASKSDLMKHVMIHIHMPASYQEDNEHKVAEAVPPHSRRRESAPAATTSAPSSAEHETETRQKINTDTLHRVAEADVYICDMCGFLFKRKHHLVRHIKVHLPIQSEALLNKSLSGDHARHHASRNPHCDICKKKFKKWSYLKNHRLIHTGKKPHSCKICKKSFRDLTKLKAHTRIHTNERPFSCEICNKNFTNSKALKRHTQIHTDERPFSCEKCNKSFTHSGALKRHTQIHTDERPFSCEICKKSFRYLSKLKEHTRIHTDERPFSCETCKKRFRLISTLKEHTRIHTDERPFSCGKCNKSFTHSGALKRHTLIHTDERPFSCEICKRSFNQSGTLKRHTHIHTDERPFSCKICKKSFRYLSGLKEHTRIHTDERPVSCEICKKRFRHLGRLKEHIRIHTDERPFACEICQKRFNHSSTLKGHKRIHTGEYPYPCELCNKKYRRLVYLTRHRLTHTGEKPFSCGVCHKRYADSRTLHSHKRTHI